MHESRSSDRKLHLGWISAAVCALLAGLFLVQLLGPSPKIIVSPETTFVTEPLRTNGLPDYEAYWSQQASVGITPENNAAPLIWQALWPGELSEEHWLALCEAMGLDRVPDSKAALVDPYDDSITEQIAVDLAKFYAESVGDENQAQDDSNADWQSLLNSGKADDAVMAASTRPWSSNQLPTLARWVKDNQQPLDLLVEASKRPRYYSPSPTTLNNSTDLLIAMLLPDIHMMRSAARSLPIRAMWLLSEGQTMDAWSDLLACHRLARLTAENNTLVGQLVAMAIEGIACRSTNVLLHHGDLSAAQARQILADLNRLEPVSNCTRAIGEGERLFFLDAALSFATGKADSADYLGTPNGPLQALSFARINWNSVLRQGNSWYDRMASATNILKREERLAELDQIEFDLGQLLSVSNSPSSVLGGLFSQNRRSEIVGNILMSLLLPATRSALNAEERTQMQLELTKLAAALAVYRGEHGEYPDQLASLVPNVLSTLPADLYSGKPCIYQRQEDGGYLLYSVFENEVDDSGTDMEGEIIEGEWVEEQPEDFDYSESDIVIRVPMPEFRLSAPPTR